MSKTSLEKIRKLPEAARSRFFDVDVNEKYAEQVFPLLTPEQNDAVTDLTLDVLLKTIKPSEFALKLKGLLKDDKKSSLVIPNILGNSFFPLAEYLGADILGLIKQYGGDPNEFRKKGPVSDVIAVVRRKAAIEIPDARVSRRLDSILTTKLNGARKDEQVIEALTGPAKTSGCGLDEASAKVLVALCDEEMLKLQKIGVLIVSDEEYAKELAEKAAAEASAEEAVAKKPAAEVITVTEDIEREARDIAAKMASTKFGIEMVDPFEAAVQQKIADAVGFCGSFCPTGDMKKRFQSLVETYFRDLRDAAETRARLLLPADKGGMAMGEADADAAMARLKAKAQEYRRALQDKVDASKKKYVAAQTQKVMSATEIQAAQEEAEMERRFAELTRKSKRPPLPPPAPEPPPSKPLPPPTVIPVIGLDEKKPVAVAPPAPALQAPSAAKTVPPPPNLPTLDQVRPPKVSAPAPAPVAPVPISEPVKPPPIVMQPIAPPPAPAVQPSSKPTMSDVAYTPKLVGPIDELRTMTLADFRRLSKDPKEATMKVKDKIDLLANQSFENKAKAVKAWHECEPNRVYLELLKRSLEGKPINNLIDEKTARGETALSKAEFDAIMALNRTLRFG